MTPPTTEQLWYDLSTLLRRFLRKRVADPAEVEDLLQEVFLRIHRGLASVEHQHRVSAWALQVARNVVVDHYRRPSNGTVALNGQDPEAEVNPESPSEVATCFAATLDRLPSKYREAVKLADVEGLPQTELALRLGLSLSGAKSRVQRGREMLREAWLACCAVQFDRFGKPIACEARGQVCNDAS